LRKPLLMAEAITLRALPWLAGRRYEMRVAGEQSSLAECPWARAGSPPPSKRPRPRGTSAVARPRGRERPREGPGLPDDAGRDDHADLLAFL